MAVLNPPLLAYERPASVGRSSFWYVRAPMDESRTPRYAPARPDRWQEFLGALAFTPIIAFALVAVTLWNVWAGAAAITLTVTAALVFRPG